MAVPAEQLYLAPADIGVIRVEQCAKPCLIFSESDKPDSRFHKFQLTLSGPVYGTYFNHGMRAELQTLLQTFAAVSGQQQCLISLPAQDSAEARDVVVVHSVKKSVERGEKNHQLPLRAEFSFPAMLLLRQPIS